MGQKTVFVFGAGASYGWNIDSTPPPVSAKFFSTARDVIRLESDGFNRRWPCFSVLKTIYGLPRKLTPFRLFQEGYFDDLNLEDVATRLFRKTQEDEQKFRHVYNNFKKLIVITIGKALNKIPRDHSCPAHDKVVRNHIGSEDTIISFNYDWVLELSLKRRWRDWGTKSDYCFQTANRLSGWRERKRPRLLKPHGSLDWSMRNAVRLMVGKTGRSRMLERLFKGHLKTETVAIVPPVLLKEQEWQGYPKAVQEHYKHIWAEAEAAIIKAKKIVFVGYSLPRGDTQAYRAILSAVQQRGCLVEIVNPDGARLREELSPIFGRQNVVWDFTSLRAYSRSNKRS